MILGIAATVAREKAGKVNWAISCMESIANTNDTKCQSQKAVIETPHTIKIDLTVSTTFRL